MSPVARSPALPRMLRLIVGMAAMALSGCATFSPDGGMSAVSDIAGTALRKDVVAIRTEDDAAVARAAVDRLLRRALSADAAVQVALLNNRGLQAAYNELSLAEAHMVQQSLPPNPTISLSRIAGAAEIEIERRIIADILALATLPARSEIARTRFRQAQLAAALETLRIAARTRRAYYRAVAAREFVEFLTQAQAAAETATQLARRLGESGAMNKLDQAREQVFYADLTAQLALARWRAAGEREALVRMLGLWGHDLNFALPRSLPGLPRRVANLPTVEVEAVRRRVDLQIARMELDALAKSLGLVHAMRFINLLDGGYADKVTREKQTGERFRDRGFDVELQVPLFDLGEVRVRQVQSVYMLAVNALLEKAVNVRSEAREAYLAYRSHFDIANHYEREILPLRKIISDETLLRYNAMQIDVFALLAEARQRIAANITAIEARRDYWLAQANLAAAVIGGVSASTAEAQQPGSAAVTPSEPAGH
jgi:outer membrane protein TolC